MLKRIEAIIREEALDDVKDALRAIGIIGMSIVEIQGHGREGGVTLSWRGTAYKMDMIPKLMITVFLSDRNVEKTIEAITKAARTGQEGDGIIFVSPVDDVYRIRTGERGGAALAYPDDIDTRKR